MTEAEQFLDAHIVIAWGTPPTTTPPPTYADTKVGRWRRDLFADLFDAAERWQRLRETPAAYPDSPLAKAEHATTTKENS